MTRDTFSSNQETYSSWGINYLFVTELSGKNLFLVQENIIYLNFLNSVSLLIKYAFSLHYVTNVVLLWKKNLSLFIFYWAPSFPRFSAVFYIIALVGFLTC